MGGMGRRRSEAFDVRVKASGDYWKGWWYDGSGRRRSRGLGPRAAFSRRQADARARQLSIDLRLKVRRDGPCPRLSEWVAQVLVLCQALDAKTLAILDHTGRYLKAFFTADPPIDRVTRLDAAGWRAALAAGQLRGANLYPKPKVAARQAASRKKLEAREPKRLSEATVAKHVRAAKRIFAEATEEDGVGLIDRNPFRKLSGRAPDPAKTWASVPAADLLRILDACPCDGWRALFALARFAGLRRGEALRLEWRDVLWNDNKLMVNQRLKRKTTKKTARVLPIEPARCPTGLHALLLGYFNAAPEGARRVCESVNADDLDRDSKRIVAAAGIAPYAKPFHALRKNRAGEIAAVYPMHVFKEWMGHDPDVAELYYLRVEE